MASFRDRPIKQKLALFFTLQSFLSLLVACAAFVGYEVLVERRNLVNDLENVAEAVSISAFAAIRFSDVSDMQKQLQTFELQKQQGVLKAAFYTPSGELFTSETGDGIAVFPPESKRQDFPEKASGKVASFDRNGLELFHPVIHKGKLIATLYVRSDLRQMFSAIRQSVLIAGGILILTVGASYFLSSILQRGISEPILHLANTARSVSEKKDYSLRVIRRSSDELGYLSDAFNQMLTQIQERDQVLNKVNQELERRVLERTRLLQESEERFRKVFEEGPMGMAFVDSNFRFLAVNDALCYMLGHSGEELMGQSFHDIVHPGEGKKDMHFWGMLFRGEISSYQNKERFVTKDGGFIWGGLNASVVRDKAGHPLHGLAILENITEQVKAEEAVRELNANLEKRVEERTLQLKEAVQELEAFSYSVSHDLRAPLRAIDGFARLISDEYGQHFDEEGHRLISIILKNTRNMGRLIDDLLAFSRLGRQEVKRVRIDMESLMRTVFEDNKPADRKIDLRIGPMPVAHGDPAMIRQVIVNLLGNAIKFTRPRDDAVIEVGGTIEGDFNRYFIKDNGVGFEMDFVHKLFGVFQRLHDVEKFEGTGVGLAIVRRIVQRHGGEVWAESKVNQGATFYFTLPHIDERNES